MSYIQGTDRGQTQLLPPSVEEYVAADAPVRVIDAFVASLDLAGMEFAKPPAATGRPAYDPADLLKLYLYGYLHRVRSSRRLEAECQRNLEVMWLLRGLRPDFWTISEFRREHRPRFQAVFREFNLLCRKLELFGAELVAIDGAKFKAVNSPRHHYTTAQLAELIARIDRQIENHLRQLDQTDAEQADLPEPPSAKELQAKLTALQRRRGQHQDLREALASAGQTEVALTDPDSRGQKKVQVGYNVQVAVDAKHDLIVTQSVEQAANDLAQLHAQASAAQAAIGVTAVVADAGYHEAGQLEKCEGSGLTTYVPAPGTRSGQTNAGPAVYPKEQFHYDATQDCYHCPGQRVLPRAGTGQKNGKDRIYYYAASACRDCPLKPQCTTGRYRKLSRLVNEAVVERQAARVRARPEIVQQRKTIVEHVFGTLRLWGHDVFLCRGLEAVRAEFTLSALAYNLRRALNVLGVAKLLATLRPAT